MASPRILIVGAGASGLMAALFAARGGANVTLLERNEKPGKKIYITGKGRCNCTNDCSLEEFLREVPRNPRFLYSALRFFSPQNLISLLEENGCPVEVQRGRRAYPQSMKASDVTKTLVSLCRNAGVQFRLNSRVSEIVIDVSTPPRLLGLRLSAGEFLPADRVILSAGGLSYPATGSTGDGFSMAKSLGHTVFPPRPSLIPLVSPVAWPGALQGLSLKNVRVTLSVGKKVLYTELGEMLFTHFGFSGPLILEASCHLPEENLPFRLELDLKPGLTEEQLDARLQRDLRAGGKKLLRNILPGLLPARLAEIFPGLCGLPESLLCSQVTAAQRQALLQGLKRLPLPVSGTRPLSEAVVTRGGVSVREVIPGTMESRIVPGVYFTGELLDVDAHTGGYNLQIAFSTGALAGASAAGS